MFRLREFEHFDALVEKLRDLLPVGRHLVDGAPVDQRDLAVAQPPRNPRAVHGRVAGAYDADALADIEILPLLRLAQERQCVKDAVAVGAVERQRLAELCTGHDDDVAEAIRA